MTENTPGASADFHDAELVAQAAPDRLPDPECQDQAGGGGPDHDPQGPDERVADEVDPVTIWCANASASARYRYR